MKKALFILFTACTLYSNAQNIITVAGGSVGDGGLSINALLGSPAGVCFDRTGNLYIAEQYYNRIRKINFSTGIITTVAGTGNAGYSGDGGVATSALLNYPSGVFVDATGNIFIADQNNNRIRKVNASTGIITTVAGSAAAGNGGDNGAATSANLNTPTGVFLDTAGNIYIADALNARIRKVNSATGIITTIAGNGTSGYAGDNAAAVSARLYWSSGVFVDAAGNIYIADQNNNRIRKVNSSTGIITTVAGNGTMGYSGDNGAATSAALNAPYGVFVDSIGNIYIADQSNHRIRKVNSATGIITTVAGNGTAGYGGDNGIATLANLKNPTGVTVDATGTIFIADRNNGCIRKINSSTGIITTIAGHGGYIGDNGIATNAYLSFPYGVSLDTKGNIYIADGYNRIRKVNSSTGIITTVAGNGIGGYYGDYGAATASNLYYPFGVSLDSSGNIYIADKFNHRTRKVNSSSGIITTVAGNGGITYSGDNGSATLASLNYPTGVFIDAGKNIYIADRNNHCIRKVNSATGIITTVAGNGTAGYGGDNAVATLASLNYPTGVFVDATGNIYIADKDNQRIRKVNSSTGIITTVAGNGIGGYYGDGGIATSANLNYPCGVTVDASGNIYIADANNNGIRKVSSATGIITTVAGKGIADYGGDNGPATSAILSNPFAVSLDSSGNLYIADAGNNRIRKIINRQMSLYRQPTNNSVCWGTNATFSVGDSNVFLKQWQRKIGSTWQNISVNTYFKKVYSDTLLISNADTTLNGYYRCYLESLHNSVFTDSVLLTVIRPGATISGNTLLCQGSSAVLQANTGNGYMYAWLKNNVVIVGASGSSYAAVTSGTYKVIVTHPFSCTDTSQGFTLVVNPLPTAGSISGQTTTILSNTSYTYTVTQQANMTYQWNAVNAVIVNGQGTNSVTVQWLNNGIGKLSLHISNSYGCMDSAAITVTIGSVPGIVSFTPISARTNDTLTIHGNNFTGTTSVKFGGVNAKSFNIISSAQIIAIVGSGASGDVAVVTPNGTATLAGFTYLSPVPGIVSFKPTSAHTDDTVTILGTNLTGSTSVKFGGVNAKSFNIITSGQINAIVGSGASGDVTVVTPNGTAALAGFTYLSSVGINSFNPNNEIEIYPNPAYNVLNIQTRQSLNGAVLTLMDISGKIILTAKLSGASLQSTDISEINTGMYFISIASENGVSNKKVIINK